MGHRADPFWNFSSANATAYWVERVIGELTTDDSLTDNAPNVAVFFDEVDQGCLLRSINAYCDALSSTLSVLLSDRQSERLLPASLHVSLPPSLFLFC